MPTLRVHDVLHDRILVSRESAHLLEDALSATLARADASGTPSVSVDFDGIQGMAPSFLDELLLIFESILGSETKPGERSLVVANPPTRLSLKFQAIARGHGMSAKALSDGSWLLSDTRRT